LPDAPQQGLVINLAQWRLFYFPPGGGRVETHPLGLGAIGQRTPLGTTRVARKDPNPTWYPPASIRAEKPELPAVVAPGPDNPLGAYALHLGWPTYLIHGTNKPDGVGRNVSHGCIRLYPEDIAKLFAAVTVGTPVRTVEQPATVGWIDDGLYVQIYPSKSQTEQLDVDRPATPEPAEMVRELVQAAAGAYVSGVDWSAVERARNERTGVPIRVATQLSVLHDPVPAYARETLHDDREPIRFEREPAETYVPYDEHQTLGPDQPDGDRDNTTRGRNGTVDRQRAAFQKLLEGLTNK
jgi:L,D-transpeptidase ErfK/SrfK